MAPQTLSFSAMGPRPGHLSKLGLQVSASSHQKHESASKQSVSLPAIELQFSFPPGPLPGFPSSSSSSSSPPLSSS
eukprot:CAMPEP_0176126800 /NCGR_PEP_ID=MMETSP0120_2-20121206/64011_1 /TAXON_ID=160619 /ORGANISM="Kryptoperidinium foliaceum, Strain CCMP 1326" /LENGTH=75 /DNA_ID=CAMNT_0017461755 /DNA_START=27 /DNA_END=250 /DNA_ORIENTATION=-